ncbi:hypothetical protein [Humibacter sp. RRB41]|uniref:hypothetical protein n=1 Tax=Humibacter sp. RRB41 TaxID=2919946 RepID=UPI001FAAD17B|nr:hypothetical protein [Humibacter sp. RRB41]
MADIVNSLLAARFQRAAKLAARDPSEWAVAGGTDVVFTVALRLSTGRDAFADQVGALTWEYAVAALCGGEPNMRNPTLRIRDF